MKSQISMNTSFQNTTGLELFLYDEYTTSRWVMSARWMRLICVPIIVVIGLVGNTLSLLVYCTRGMKSCSCSVFLAALAAVDNTFILGALLNWVNDKLYAILKTDLSCQVLIFMTYAASFLSVWFIVGFTCEWYIAIRFPLKRAIMCSVGREKVVVLILTLLTCFLYNFSFWTTVAIQSGTEMQCTYRGEYFGFLNIAIWIDTCITMVIPFLIITCVDSLVVRRLLVSTKKTAELRQARCGDQTAELHPSLRVASDRKYTDGRKVFIRRTKVIFFLSKSPHLRVTRNLLCVSLTFLCLNLPIYVIRLYSLIGTGVTPHHTMSAEFYFVRELAQMLYYTTFSCHFFIYTLFMRNFKRSLMLIIRCKSAMHDERKKVITKLLPVHRINTSSL